MKALNILQVITLLLCLLIGYFVYNLSKEIKTIHLENEVLCCKIDSLQKLTTQSKKSSTVSKKKPTTFWEMLSDEFEESEKIDRAIEAKQKITIKSTYRLEDRYVCYGIDEPDERGTSEGTVVLDIIVNNYGDVKTARLNPTTTITDEEVIEAAKKVALQTHFNSNYDAPNEQDGKIIFTYKKKK